ncbi:MAG: ISAs1 family transposase [Treponema sp.]
MTLLDAMEEIEDYRIDLCKKHELVDILMICLLGFFIGLTDIESTAFWAKKQKDRLTRVIGLKNGTPGADTIHRVLAMIDDKQLEKAFFSWTHGMFKANPPKKDEIEVVALDGKTIRRSNTTGGKKGAHIVSAWADRLGIALPQVKVDEKSNEITAVPELLELMDLKGVIVTIDAMGCQKKIVEKITEKKSDYLISLKGNQSTLHDDVKEFFSRDDKKFFEKFGVEEFTFGIEKDHGRTEKRDYKLCTSLGWLEQKDEWANLKGVGMVKSTRIAGGIKTVDVRYFITSLTHVETAAKSMRSHWGIENNLHWILDMMYNEDYTQSRKDHSPQNPAVLRKIALNLFKTAPNPTGKANFSLHKKQITCMCDDDYLKTMLQLL